MTPRARQLNPAQEHLSVKLFTDLSAYDHLVARLKKQNTDESSGALLTEPQILLSCRAKNRNEAIRLTGNAMVEMGLVQREYIEEMIQREIRMSTYIGNGVAVPHGMDGNSPNLLKPGIVVAQFPEGVAFENHIAYLLIGIAGYSDRQIRLLSMIAQIVEDEQNIQFIRHARTKKEVLSIFRPLNDLATRG